MHTHTRTHTHLIITLPIRVPHSFSAYHSVANPIAVAGVSNWRVNLFNVREARMRKSFRRRRRRQRPVTLCRGVGEHGGKRIRISSSAGRPADPEEVGPSQHRLLRGYLTPTHPLGKNGREMCCITPSVLFTRERERERHKHTEPHHLTTSTPRTLKSSSSVQFTGPATDPGPLRPTRPTHTSRQ